VTGIVALVRCTVVAGLAGFLHIIPKAVDLLRPVGRPDRNPAELVLQRLQQILAKVSSRCNRKIWIAWHVGHSVDRGDIREQEIAHEERLGQTDAPKVGERRN